MRLCVYVYVCMYVYYTTKNDSKKVRKFKTNCTIMQVYIYTYKHTTSTTYIHSNIHTSTETVAKLLAWGADMKIKNKNGHTVLEEVSVCMYVCMYVCM